jgi:hypothetical protein
MPWPEAGHIGEAKIMSRSRRIWSGMGLRISWVPSGDLASSTWSVGRWCRGECSLRHLDGQQAQADGIFERHIGMDAGGQFVVDGGARLSISGIRAEDALAMARMTCCVRWARSKSPPSVWRAGVSQRHRAIHHLAAGLQDNRVVVANGSTLIS